MAALILLAAACASEHGPWVDADGNRVPNGLILEFDGPSSCGWSSVTFIRFFGDQYARDPERALGALQGPDGNDLTYDEVTEPPAGAEPTGITHGDREILIDEAQRDDYLFMSVGDSLVERWPRAELTCPAMPGPQPEALGRHPGPVRSVDERHLVDEAPRPVLTRFQ